MAAALAVVLLPLWLHAVYGQGRSLLKVMRKKNPARQFASVYASDELEDAILRLGGRGTSIPRRWLTGRFMVFVDAGDRFKLWGSSRGGPERLLAVPWDAVSAATVGVVDFPAMTDRALLLDVSQQGPKVRLALPLNKRSLSRLIPLSDAEFAAELTAVRNRVVQQTAQDGF